MNYHAAQCHNIVLYLVGINCFKLWRAYLHYGNLEPIVASFCDFNIKDSHYLYVAEII